MITRGKNPTWRRRLAKAHRATPVPETPGIPGSPLRVNEAAVSTPVDTLFFDGQCPLCAAEISRLREQRAGALALVDIHEMDAPSAGVKAEAKAGVSAAAKSPAFPGGSDYSASVADAPAIEKDRLLRTLHLRRADGSWLTGADANVAAWEGTRHGRALAFLRWPLIRYPVDLGYALWARWRYARLYGKGSTLRASSPSATETTPHVPD